jgi:hypothetical protein
LTPGHTARNDRTVGSDLLDELLHTGLNQVILFGQSQSLVAALIEAESLKDLRWIIVTQGEMSWNSAKPSEAGFFSNNLSCPSFTLSFSLSYY